jgi:hypothetical protein
MRLAGGPPMAVWWRSGWIDVEDFPAFSVVNDRDNDSFELVSTAVSLG